METIREDKQQVLLRFDRNLVRKIKYYAQKEGKSINAYAEECFSADIHRRETFPHLPVSGAFSPQVESLTGILAGRIPPEDLKNDDRLAYILGK